MNKFHEQAFDDSTMTKLDIFKFYTRSWISVIMTEKRERKGFEQAQIYDFFSGPGRGGNGEIGSPLILIEELKQYCVTRADLKNPNISVRLFFNDKKSENIERLRAEIESIKCRKSCCEIKLSSKAFSEALNDEIGNLRASGIAKLVLLDQFGVKEVTRETLETLSALPNTDVLFFFSSSTISRFISDPVIQEKFPDLSVKEIQDIPYKMIHKYMCRYFKDSISKKDYHLAPFSLKKKGNIYGVIFGSNHILGLEKFLNVCWDLDEVSGQANYNLDDDSDWHRRNKPFTPSLFGEIVKPKRLDIFKNDLIEFIKESSPTNKDLYKFSLENGIPPKKVREILLEIENEKNLKIEFLDSKKGSRKKGSYYIGWDNYKKDLPIIRIVLD